MYVCFVLQLCMFDICLCVDAVYGRCTQFYLSCQYCADWYVEINLTIVLSVTTFSKSNSINALLINRDVNLQVFCVFPLSLEHIFVNDLELL